MKRHQAFRGLLLFAALGMAETASAHQSAHVHGLVRLDVVVEANSVSVLLAAPLDSLLGFEHKPRTDAQKKAAEALLKQMNQASSLIRPEASAACIATKVNIESEVLQSTKPARAKDEGHADFNASFEFICEQPDKLRSIEIDFFDSFKRIQKIEVRVAGAKQSKLTLKRPEKILRLP